MRVALNLISKGGWRGGGGGARGKWRLGVIIVVVGVEVDVKIPGTDCTIATGGIAVREDDRGLATRAGMLDCRNRR